MRMRSLCGRLRYREGNITVDISSDWCSVSDKSSCVTAKEWRGSENAHH